MSETEVYDTFERNGVIALGTAGIICLVAIVLALVLVLPGRKPHKTTQLLGYGYFVSMLVSNIIQSIGNAMNFRWVAQGAVSENAYCSAQGGIKQAGNVGNAVWSFLISCHLFNLLFLRLGRTSRKAALIGKLVAGWSFVVTIVLIGPGALQSPKSGPYFGVSGSWCWITEGYPTARFFLEYFFEYLSAGGSFLLYTAILLRVRGNIAIIDGKLRLRWVSRGDSWKLSIHRDFIDSSMLQVTKQMVWYPIAYSILIVPIGLARLTEFAGAKVPQWATFVTAVIFNLTGLVNVLLLLYTNYHFAAEVQGLPEFTTPRKKLHLSTINSHGVTPFTLTRSTSSGSQTPSLASTSESEKPLPVQPDDIHRLPSPGGRRRVSSVAAFIDRYR